MLSFYTKLILKLFDWPTYTSTAGGYKFMDIGKNIKIVQFISRFN